MNSKIRIKVGDIEVEYEGAEEFLKKELPELLKTVTSLHVVVPSSGASPRVIYSKGDIKLTTGNIAAKINCDSGADLVIAACAHFHFVQKKETFDRREILREMKTATSYYKSSYSNNLSGSLKTLVQDGKLIEPSSSVFSLPASTIQDLNAKLT